MTAARLRSPLLAMLILALTLAAPAASHADGLRRYARLADGFSPEATQWLERDAWVRVGGELRPAITAGRVLNLHAAWEPGGAMFAVAPWPGAETVPPWVFARLARMVPGTGRLQHPPVALRANDVPGSVRLGPFTDVDASKVSQFFADVTLVPDLGSRDLVSMPVDIPSGAELQVAYAIEETAWNPGSPALEFTVSALSGATETVLMRATLDPANRPADRHWVDARVSLAGLAGSDVRLRFRARSTTGDGASLPLWSEPIVLAPADRDPPLGVVLISLDTLRAKSTSGGGASRPTTPWLNDDVGGMGVTFDNAITTAPHTLPAHVSMFTGRYLRSHGVRSPLVSIAPDHHTVTEALYDAGWSTAAFTENGFVLPDVGLRRGFQQYRENKSADLHRPEGFAANVFGDGLAWLDRHRDQPFFLFLHTYQVHFPYVPPPPYDAAFEPASLLASPNDVELLRYEQEARCVDDILGVFLEGLAALGLRQRTLVVVTADHGEEFYEHGQTQHILQLYDEVARVPLVMRLPGMFPSGVHVDTPVSIVDVAPTILDVVGLAPLPGADGRSLVPLALEGPRRFQRDAVFAESLTSWAATEVDLVAVRRGGLSCIVRLGPGASECFDRTVDPGEESPLRFGPADRRMDEVQELVGRFVREGTAAAGGTPAVGVPDAERLEKLRALGYLQ